jgi:DNA-binding NarL/FixJ family response regulator
MDSYASFPTQTTVMTISRDLALQATRTLILEKEGYVVIALINDHQVHSFLSRHEQPRLDMVLLCHSVPESSRIALCDALKGRHPDTPILMLYNGYDPTAASVDGRLQNTHSPKALVSTIRLLIGGPLHRRPPD